MYPYVVIINITRYATVWEYFEILVLSWVIFNNDFHMEKQRTILFKLKYVKNEI